ncbi:hypothetical protein F5Y10DRAFT_270111 [Nemania abortiva]|nr:hypothetical protein F5Y10DRAFT_270111 [Nemania abortiva]
MNPRGDTLPLEQSLNVDDYLYCRYAWSGPNDPTDFASVATWASNTTGQPVARLTMQMDGNLVAYDSALASPSGPQIRALRPKTGPGSSCSTPGTRSYTPAGRMSTPQRAPTTNGAGSGIPARLGFCHKVCQSKDCDLNTDSSDNSTTVGVRIGGENTVVCLGFNIDVTVAGWIPPAT